MRATTRVLVAVATVLSFVPAASPRAAGADGKGPQPKHETDVCVYAARGSAAQHAQDAKPGNGTPGGGPKSPSCSKTFAKWTVAVLDVYVDDTGRPGTVNPGTLATYAQHAFNEWSCKSGLGTTPTVNFVSSASGAEITIGWSDLGSTGILGQTSTSYLSGVILSSSIAMNSDQSGFFWTEGPPPAVDAGGCAIEVGNGNTSSSNYDVLSVLLHEIGHALGLSHPNNRCRTNDACYHESMYSCTDAEEYERRAVNAGDAAAISGLYGP